MRLIDDLLYLLEQTKYTLFEEGEPTYQRLMSALRFQIDNVATYAYGSIVSVGNDGQRIGHIMDIVPNAAPLAPSMWFEFGGLAKNAEKPATNLYGCLVSVEYDRKHHTNLFGLEVPEHARWILRCQGFANVSSGLVCMRTVPWLSVTEDGTPSMYAASSPAREEPSLSKGQIFHEILVALLAICFVHCKGTKTEEHQPSRQVRRAAERTGKPIFSFHTIDINPSVNVLRTEGRISENGISKALHICRGHFAHYTTEKPLFGKYTGTFYRPMHVRGNSEQGSSVSNYRVHPPEPARGGTK